MAAVTVLVEIRDLRNVAMIVQELWVVMQRWINAMYVMEIILLVKIVMEI